MDNSSKIGPIFRQGTHQGAQKSTTTGFSDSRTSAFHWEGPAMSRIVFGGAFPADSAVFRRFFFPLIPPLSSLQRAPFPCPVPCRVRPPGLFATAAAVALPLRGRHDMRERRFLSHTDRCADQIVQPPPEGRQVDPDEPRRPIDTADQSVFRMRSCFPQRGQVTGSSRSSTERIRSNFSPHSGHS